MNDQNPGMSSKQMNARLKAAVNSVEVPPFLDAKIRHNIRVPQPAPRKRWAWLTGAAAVAGLAIAGIITYQLRDIRQNAGEQESFIVSISSRVGTLMRVGLGDHVHCAFFRKFPSEAPAVEEMESKLGSEYKELIPVVRQRVPEEYKLVLGHECRYHGRRFIHLSLKNDDKLLSLVITAKRPGETFDIKGTLPQLVHAGIPMYTSTTDRFQVAAMETTNHLIYFISDLPAGENSQLLVAMAPEIKAILENLEG
jgi:hypothetical protein